MQGNTHGNDEIETGSYENRAARSLLNHPVHFVVKATGEPFEAECSNVSSSGMFLKCTILPPVGSDIAFRFMEQGIVLIQGEARVARHVLTESKTGVGVFFTSLDQLARRMIDRVVTLNAEDKAAAQAAEPAAEPAFAMGGLSLDAE